MDKQREGGREGETILEAGAQLNREILRGREAEGRASWKGGIVHISVGMTQPSYERLIVRHSKLRSVCRETIFTLVIKVANSGEFQSTAAQPT